LSKVKLQLQARLSSQENTIPGLKATLPDQGDSSGEFLDLVLDPLSAAQTVENLFDLSFLGDS
jgi:hypothetical protein